MKKIISIKKAEKKLEKDTLGVGKKKKRKRSPKRMKNHSDIGVLGSYTFRKESFGLENESINII